MNAGSRNSTKAVYIAPATNHTFEQFPAAVPGTNVKAKQAYFAALRASTKQLQKDINIFLTEKMEEDKVKTNGVSSHLAKDEEEEENYGEEKVEED